MVDIVLGCDRGFRGFAVPRHQARLRPDRRQWRGLRACGKHCSACNKSKGEFQKVTAFHDISSLANRERCRKFRCAQMNNR
jgi:hypothetical protein